MYSTVTKYVLVLTHMLTVLIGVDPFFSHYFSQEFRSIGKDVCRDVGMVQKQFNVDGRDGRAAEQ